MASKETTSGGLLTVLLRDVSRSFFLTMRVLPGAIRPQISLAYLLARTTDTIADTEVVPVIERLDALDQLRARILGETSARLDFTRFAEEAEFQPAAIKVPGEEGRLARTLRAERALLARAEEALALLATFSMPDQQRIRELLAIITSGQELDLRRFGRDRAGWPRPAADPGSREERRFGENELGPNPITALQTDAELDDYTYRVAGCVGEFWTRMCRAHLFPKAAMDESLLLANAARFGKGLQLVNILRDLPVDLRRQRCYLPAQRLSAAGLAASDLLLAASEPKLRLLYDDYLDLAESHLAAGWAYTNTLPRGQVRVRLACAWPILIGAQTVAKLRSGTMLDPHRRIKITRAELRHTLVRSVLTYPSATAWKDLFARTAK